MIFFHSIDRWLSETAFIEGLDQLGNCKLRCSILKRMLNQHHSEDNPTHLQGIFPDKHAGMPHSSHIHLPPNVDADFKLIKIVGLGFKPTEFRKIIRLLGERPRDSFLFSENLWLVDEEQRHHLVVGYVIRKHDSNSTTAWRPISKIWSYEYFCSIFSWCALQYMFSSHNIWPSKNGPIWTKLRSMMRNTYNKPCAQGMNGSHALATDST